MKTKITALAEELDVSVNEIMMLKCKLEEDEWKGHGKNTWFQTEEAVEKLRLALDIPLAVPDVLTGSVLRSARNPNWVYAKIIGMEGKHPVAIPRRLREKLVGKKIQIHAITDINGTTYRHAKLTGRN